MGRKDLSARLIALIVAVPLLSAWWPFGKLEWPTFIAKVRKEFPAVRHLSTSELAALPPAPAFVLIDTRTSAEFAVSHLRGALRAETLSDAQQIVSKLPPDQRVVLYCSVGYRSAKIADALGRQGHKNVWNLEGSIFAWANEGRPVVRGDNEVREVHPYNERWGALLERRLWPQAGWKAQ